MKIKANNTTRAKNRVLGILIALGVIVFICIITAISAAENRKTIAVVRIKSDTPISSNALITEDMVESYDMYYKEFNQYGTMQFSDGSKRSVIVRWADRDLIIGKRYAAYFLRQGTVLFWDQTMKQQTKKNSYLYSMDGELLNIHMETTNDFGDMVVPGDTLNIRCSYTKTNYDLPSEEQYKLSLDQGQSINSAQTQVNELLFSEVQILDMLNSDGASIFDIYYDYISASKGKQTEALNSDDFLASVKPKSILIKCTAEEADRFMAISAKKPTYLLTLLPRTSSSAIIDSLSDIQEALKKAQADSANK